MFNISYTNILYIILIYIILIYNILILISYIKSYMVRRDRYGREKESYIIL